jgi:hypothetical protein
MWRDYCHKHQFHHSITHILALAMNYSTCGEGNAARRKIHIFIWFSFRATWDRLFYLSHLSVQLMSCSVRFSQRSAGLLRSSAASEVTSPCSGWRPGARCIHLSVTFTMNRNCPVIPTGTTSSFSSSSDYIYCILMTVNISALQIITFHHCTNLLYPARIPLYKLHTRPLLLYFVYI